jgi:anthranilate phosphoribosyltransferase
VERDAIALLRVIMGRDEGPRRDIVCLNAAPLLYVMGKAKNLKDGIVMAREAIRTGKALEKLRAWVTWQNAKPDEGLAKLQRMIARV